MVDPAEAKTLLEDFESGALVVSVSRQEPGALIYPVFVIESEPNKLFQGVQNGECCWGTEGIPIKDRMIADRAIEMLSDMSHQCRVQLIRMKTTEKRITRTLLDLGFVLQEKDNETN